MQRNISKQGLHSLHTMFCLLVLTLMLFLAACGGGSGSPSSPSGTPAPTKSGYSVIYHRSGQTIQQQYHLHLGPGR